MSNSDIGDMICKNIDYYLYQCRTIQHWDISIQTYTIHNINQMKNPKYQTVETVPKSHREIVERGKNRYSKHTNT